MYKQSKAEQYLFYTFLGLWLVAFVMLFTGPENVQEYLFSAWVLVLIIYYWVKTDNMRNFIIDQQYKIKSLERELEWSEGNLSRLAKDNIQLLMEMGYKEAAKQAEKEQDGNTTLV